MPPRRRTRLIIALTIAGAFVTYLAGNGSSSLFDRDEPRYAQCSREMIHGSPEHPGADYVVPRHLGELRYAKPAGIYWCQAAAMKLFGDADGAGVFAARLPSAVAMPITLILVALGVWRWAGARRAAWTVFVLATSVITIVSAKACLTDSVLLLWITIAQGCLYLAWRGRVGWGTWAIMGIVMGAAVMIKGPVVFGVMGMTLLALINLRLFDRWLAKHRAAQNEPKGAFPVVTNEATASTLAGASERRLNHSEPTIEPATFTAATAFQLLLALLLMAAVVAPWLYMLHQREPTFLGTSVSHDVVNRIKTGLEGHSAPPGYHLVTIWGTYLPWSILLPMSIVFAWKRRHLPPIRFALCAVIGPWLMFEIVQTKLPHYMLPVFPFLAFLTADAIVRCLRGQHGDLRRDAFVKAIAGSAVVLGIVACGPLALSLWFGQGVGYALLLLLIGWTYVVTVVYLFAARRPMHGLIAMGTGMLVVNVAVWTIFLPHSDPLRLSMRVADQLNREGATGANQVVMLDYKEPSLPFYQGGTIREIRETFLTDTIVDAAPPWIVLTREVWESPKTSPSARDRLEIVGTFDGLAYADSGRRVTVMVVRKKRG
jgi:4-amino-4-deoxy-L-arabinose transferase-like glycosyltransferase